MSKYREPIKHWLENLTAEQMKPFLVNLIDFSIDAEMVSFGDLAPYWSNTGEPLVEGQKCYLDED